MKERLIKGDIILVYNPLFENGVRQYPVLKVQGNKAYTKFRTFNTKIYAPDMVYEYGKRLNDIYNNDYRVKLIQ